MILGNLLLILICLFLTFVFRCCDHRMVADTVHFFVGVGMTRKQPKSSIDLCEAIPTMAMRRTTTTLVVTTRRKVTTTTTIPPLLAIVAVRQKIRTLPVYWMTQEWYWVDIGTS